MVEMIHWLVSIQPLQSTVVRLITNVQLQSFSLLLSENANSASFTLTDENGEIIQLRGLNLTLMFHKKDPD